MFRHVQASGARVAFTDSGGRGPVVLFLHGLAGHRGEWQAATSPLSTFRCVALDLRGHGDSERRPADVTPGAHVEDVKTVVDNLGAGRVHLVGQSYGGHIAFLFAAAHPQLVRSLLVVEASPRQPGAQSVARVQAWLDSWPRPFPSRQHAVSFFGNGSRAEAWVQGLEVRSDGLWPRYDREVLFAMLAHLRAREWWDEWERIRCPTLLVRGEKGVVEDEDADRMAASGPRADVVMLTHSGHDAHLERPTAFSEVLVDFLS